MSLHTVYALTAVLEPPWNQLYAYEDPSLDSSGFVMYINTVREFVCSLGFYKLSNAPAPRAPMCLRCGQVVAHHVRGHCPFASTVFTPAILEIDRMTGKCDASLVRPFLLCP